MSHLHHIDQKPLKNYKLTGMRLKTLNYLKDGVRLSELKGLKLGLGTSLRTRISELRAMGYPIEDEFVTSSTGSRYKEYFIVGAKPKSIIDRLFSMVGIK